MKVDNQPFPQFVTTDATIRSVFMMGNNRKQRKDQTKSTNL